MFREGTCPKCHEKIQVPDNREKIICMFCGEEIRVEIALGEEKEIDQTALHEKWNDALAGLRETVRTCRKPMKNFKKDLYEGVFDSFYSEHKQMFDSMEYVYQNGSRPEEWIKKLTECVVEEAKEDLNSYKAKNQKSQRLLDHNFLISIYLVPAMLKYPAEISEPFADHLIASWNETFKTSIGKATYDNINSGFRRKLCYITTAICGSLGKGTDCYELRLLKQYRDQYLDTTPEGHALVEEYYNVAPTIVKRIEKQPDKAQIYQKMYLDYLMPCIRKIEEQDYESCAARYKEMVLTLKDRYMNEQADAVH